MDNFDRPTPAFSAIRARVVMGILVAALLATVVIAELLWPAWSDEAAALPDALFGVGFYMFAVIALWIVSRRAGGLDWTALGSAPYIREAFTYILFSVPLIGIAFAGFYLVYLPLSYVAPDIVTWLILDTPTGLDWRSGPDEFIGVGLNIVLIVVIAPVVEEVLFRGFLLNRWWGKYGFRRAAIFSSLAFGLFHVEFVGAMIFGVALSVIYARTRSLICTIIVHVANNAIACFAILLVYALDLDGPNTLELFRAYWWLGLLGAVIGIPWLMWLVKRWSPRAARFVAANGTS